MDSLRKWRTAALTLIALLVAAASLAAFAESYRGLFDWAREHGLSGFWADVWPLQLDAFIAIGELTLFVGLADSWPRRNRIAAWAVTVIGAGVSVAGNVGHVAGHDIASRVTAAVPPVAAASALAVALGVLKRVIASARQGDTARAAPVASSGTLRNWFLSLWRWLRRKDAAPDIVMDNQADIPVDTPRPEPVTTPTSEAQSMGQLTGQNGGQPKRQKGDKLARLLVTSPELPVAELAKRAGVSERTVIRRRSAVRQSLGSAHEPVTIGAVNGTPEEG